MKKVYLVMGVPLHVENPPEFVVSTHETRDGAEDRAEEKNSEDKRIFGTKRSHNYFVNYWYLER